jgi:hypothetical protein
MARKPAQIVVLIDFILSQAFIKNFSSWQQASQTKNFLPIFFINLNFGCNSITASCI